MVEAGGLDIALLLVPESEVRTTDHVMWTDDLVWIVGENAYIGDGPIPLVTFA
jgi:DNA-binding transcriptional LysR family regulator